ncbi:hypothetical protein AHF37_02199 [Paragonimus kellicotti]|nr:hypothetical protein AHF37_02199 [Paragonimus kellicotti]
MERDVILADFQACTGLHDVEYCISVLEAHDWNLTEAVTSALTECVTDTYSDVPTSNVELLTHSPVDPEPGSRNEHQQHTEPSPHPVVVPNIPAPPSPTRPRIKAATSQATNTEPYPVIEVDAGPVLSSGSVRILHFDIHLELPAESHSSGPRMYQDCFTFPETETVGSLKHHFIERGITELTLLATSPGWASALPEITPNSLLAHLSFEGHSAHSFNDNSVTLRLLHLPKFNTIRAELVQTPMTSDRPDTSLNTKSTSHIELRVHVCNEPASTDASSLTNLGHSSSTPHGFRTHALRLRPEWRVNRICHDVASLVGVPTSRQFWSVESPRETNVTTSTDSELNRLVLELNRHCLRVPSNGVRTVNTTPSNPSLRDLGLRSDTVYVLYLNEKSGVPSGQDLPSKSSMDRKNSNPREDSVMAPGSCSPRSDLMDRTSSKRPLDHGGFHHQKRSERMHSFDNPPEVDDDYEDDDMEPVYFSDDIVDEVEPQKSSVWSTPLISDSGYEGDPGEAIEQFCHLFIQRYCGDGETMAPPFITGSLDTALTSTVGATTVAERKPLFVYLHNDESVACHVFCQKILCSTSVCQFFGENDFSLWPWDVTRPRAKERLFGWLENKLPNLASVVIPLSVDSYPVLAMVGKISSQLEVLCVVLGTGAVTSLLSPKPPDDMNFPPLDSPGTNRPSLRPFPVASSGCLKEDVIVSELWQAYTTYLEMLAPEQAAETERLARQLVREEQERAYQESLRLDKLKALTAEKERLEQERMKQERFLEESEATKRRLQMAATLPPEPPAPSTLAAEAFLASPKGAGGIACLRFRLPRDHPGSSSAKPSEAVNGFLGRRFSGLDKLKHVLAYIESQGFPKSGYKLLTTYPRRDLTMLDENATMVDLKLVPQETLTLEER